MTATPRWSHRSPQPGRRRRCFQLRHVSRQRSAGTPPSRSPRRAAGASPIRRFRRAPPVATGKLRAEVRRIDLTSSSTSLRNANPRLDGRRARPSVDYPRRQPHLSLRHRLHGGRSAPGRSPPSRARAPAAPARRRPARHRARRGRVAPACSIGQPLSRRIQSRAVADTLAAARSAESARREGVHQGQPPLSMEEVIEGRPSLPDSPC